jgi:itaconate CoA-transferase
VVLQDASLASDERFSSNARRHEHREALRQLILGMFADMSAEQVVARLDQAQIANARVNTMQELWQHPQLAARERWVDVDTPVGKVAALLPPGANDSYDYRMQAIPALGEHTDTILATLGYDAAAITALRERGAV